MTVSAQKEFASVPNCPSFPRHHGVVQPIMGQSGVALYAIRHSFWFLPNVAACHAMASLLAEKHNTFWHEYEVVVAAGASAGIARSRCCRARSPFLSLIMGPIGGAGHRRVHGFAGCFQCPLDRFLFLERPTIAVSDSPKTKPAEISLQALIHGSRPGSD